MAKTYTAYNIRIILVLTLGSLTFGYTYSVISNTLGQPGFIAKFDLGSNSSYANAISGAINGVFAAGGVFGALTTGWMCEARGRKETMNLAALISIIGSALQTGSVDIAMFLVARFIAGWGIGMMVVLIPIYQAEICERPNRGFDRIHIDDSAQRHRTLVASSSDNMGVGSLPVTHSPAGSVLGRSIQLISHSNGAFPSLCRVCRL